MGFVGSDSVKLIPFLMTESESAIALQPMADSLGDRIPKHIKEHVGTAGGNVHLQMCGF